MADCGICCLSDWSPQSPDLDIIEALWSDLKGGVVKFRPTCIEKLGRTYEDKLAQIPVEKVKKLYESLPRRIEEVIKMKGRNTHY